MNIGGDILALLRKISIEKIESHNPKQMFDPAFGEYIGQANEYLQALYTLSALVREKREIIYSRFPSDAGAEGENEYQHLLCCAESEVRFTDALFQMEAVRIFPHFHDIKQVSNITVRHGWLIVCLKPLGNNSAHRR